MFPETHWKTLPYLTLTLSQMTEMDYKQDLKGKYDGLKVTKVISQG